MGEIFFFGTVIVLLVLLILIIGKKGFRFCNLFLWFFYSLYSLTYEILFSEIFHLYYYISYSQSIIYILIASFFLYPPIVLIYVMYMPRKEWRVLYTCGWIALILVLELTSIYTKTIVLTGWRIVPWSIITYVLTYILIYLADKYLKRILPGRNTC